MVETSNLRGGKKSPFSIKHLLDLFSLSLPKAAASILAFRPCLKESLEDIYSTIIATNPLVRSLIGALVNSLPLGEDPLTAAILLLLLSRQNARGRTLPKEAWLSREILNAKLRKFKTTAWRMMIETKLKLKVGSFSR